MKVVILSREVLGRKWKFVREDEVSVHPVDHERALNGGLLSDEAALQRPLPKCVYRVEKAKGWWAELARRKR